MAAAAPPSDGNGMAGAGRTSIRGGWIGTRTPRSSVGVPVRFEATFTAPAVENGPSLSGGAFGGTILDDARSGASRVSHGLQSGRHVRFRQTDEGGHEPPSSPLHYQGTLSEDGQRAAGTWESKMHRNGRVIRTTGHWEAHRLFWADGDIPPVQIA